MDRQFADPHPGIFGFDFEATRVGTEPAATTIQDIMPVFIVFQIFFARVEYGLFRTFGLSNPHIGFVEIGMVVSRSVRRS